MNQNQGHTASTPMSYAVFFGEDGEDVATSLSELPDGEEQKGGYLLITPGVGSSWVPRTEEGGYVINGSLIQKDSPLYEPSRSQHPTHRLSLISTRK